MDMVYDTIHNIALKNQLHTIIQPSQQAITQKKTSYNFAYAYNPSGVNSLRPHAPTHIDLRTYSYDLDGNQTGWTHDTNGTRRTITWDEENRIQSVADNGQTKDYKYDDQGQRMIKRGPQGETVYVNQFFTQRPGATGTKHIYAGTSRIASKLVRQDTPNSNPNGNTPFEKDLYFFHPDHLGSSNYVTDLNGKLYEHLEYFPFGEAWVEENSNQQRTPFLFSAKELDEETGLYYFGARYYDPRTSVWQSADPALMKYLPSGNKERDAVLMGMGGVFEPKNMSLYAYSHQNPVVYLDPDGLSTWPTKSTQIVGNNVNANAGYFGYSRDSGTTWHGGVDIGGKIGDNVVAFKSGTVIRAGWENPADHHEGFGQRIVVEHDDNGVKTYSVYGHLDTMKVKLGDVIAEGQGIGTLGTTGNAFNVPNPHLHFEVRKDSYPGSSLNNLDPRSQFSAWDRVKSFFSGLFGAGPMFIPDTHINTQTNAQNQNLPQQGSP